MNRLLIKQTSILSAIFGAILGVLTLIPFIRNFSFALLFLCISTVVIIYMRKYNLIGAITVQEGAILGGIIGFVSFIVFSIVFTPLAIFVGWIFPKTYMGYISNFLKMLPFFMFVMLSVFGGILSATINAFAGLATAYGYDMLLTLKNQEAQAKIQEKNVTFEIK